MLYATLASLLPSITAIAFAFVSKEVYLSLFAGILVGAIVISGANPITALQITIQEGIISSISDTSGILVFLVILGALVNLINKSGGTAAFADFAKKHIKSRIGACVTTVILGIIIFIDDYFNCLTVGNVMQPITDKHRISRAKLAYMIDSTAAPICILSPMSSWAAAVSQFATGTRYSGIELFIRAIPYNFYPLLTIAFLFAIIVMDFDFGPMKKEVDFDKMDFDSSENKTNGKVIHLIAPILILIILCTFSLIYIGFINGGTTLISYMEKTDASVALPLGALTTFIFVFIYFTITKVFSFKEAVSSLTQGFTTMVPAILILTLATSLKNITSLLGAHKFIADLMDSSARTLSSFLPCVIFLTATLLSFATGTSWGTFGILIPIITSVFEPDSIFLIIGISACLSGAVCGDHCSPISDTTIISSAGAGCGHMVHVSTQLPYALSVAAVSFIIYFISAFTQNAALLLLTGTAIIISGLLAARSFFRR